MSALLFIFTANIFCRLSCSHNFSSSSRVHKANEFSGSQNEDSDIQIKTHYIYFSFIYIFVFVTFKRFGFRLSNVTCLKIYELLCMIFMFPSFEKIQRVAIAVTVYYDALISSTILQGKNR